MSFVNSFSSGIYVAQILKDGPSFGKGLKEGDIITKIDDKSLNTINDLREYIYTKKPGDKVVLNINNKTGKAIKEIEITLGKK